MTAKRIIIGIDEAGRGPLVGPLTLAACIIVQPRSMRNLRARLADPQKPNHYKDSKMWNEKDRERLHREIKKFEQRGVIDTTHTSLSAQMIDEKGMSYCLKKGVQILLRRLCKKYDLSYDSCEVLLDGRLYAPRNFIYQRTITKGDTKEISVAVASLIAKVKRDRYMRKLAMVHPEYGFEKHKGYGTQKHYHAIEKYGVIGEHRRSFLKKA